MLLIYYNLLSKKWYFIKQLTMRPKKHFFFLKIEKDPNKKNS